MQCTVFPLMCMASILQVYTCTCKCCHNYVDIIIRTEDSLQMHTETIVHFVIIRDYDHVENTNRDACMNLYLGGT